MSSANRAVFLSYASQDGEAARRIAEGLRAAGIEVWFDQSGLKGGDAWDAAIRRQIKECALFVPVISANTQARAEGYFRLEWRLAVAEWGRKNTIQSDEALNQLIRTHGDLAAAQIAEIYAFRRDNERAFEWLERSFQQRDPGLAGSRLDPFLSSLHEDPRWDPFLRKLGLADDQLP